MRRAIFWLHLVAGCAAGLVILVLAGTGALMAYERQLVDFAERGYRGPPTNAHLAPEALLQTVQAAAGATPTAVTVRRDPAAPVQVSLGRERTVMVHSATGEILGEGS